MKGFSMNKRRIAAITIISLLVVALMACDSNDPLDSRNSSIYATITPAYLAGLNQAPEYSAAQATLAAGQNQIAELSHQATTVSLSQDQAANAAAQATLNYNERQLLELSIRETEVSQNMAWALATQQYIAEQTQAVWNAAATAQNQAAEATYAAYALNVTQTVQAQANLAIQANLTAQANATQAAYSLTATPLAMMQADVTRFRNETLRRAWWEEFIVTPVKLALIILIVFLFLVGVIMTYRLLMPVLMFRMSGLASNAASPLLLLDGNFVDIVPTPPQLPKIKPPQVDIVDSTEPSVVNWITEAELKLRTNGGKQA
jgi:hypothetical protein